MIAFLLLPAFTDMRRSRAFWGSLAAALALFMVSRRVVDNVYLAEGPSLLDSVLEHRETALDSLSRLLTLGGRHDLQSGFSLLLPLARIGAWLNRRYRYHELPTVLAVTVPIALGLAILSGNMGRMAFAAFPAVIAYALIAVEHTARVCGTSRNGAD